MLVAMNYPRFISRVKELEPNFSEVRLDKHCQTLFGHLRGSGLPDELRQQATSLLQTCDALRFSAVPPAVSGSLVDAARELILALEARTWSSLPS